jgi:nitrate/nitrite-specific signal transduction histidine kinase
MYDKKARKYLHQIRKSRRRKKGIKLILRTEEQAKRLLEKAKLENIFPKGVQKQIKRLEKNWTNFTHCLRDKKIPPTSNKVEQFYAMTLNWIEKKTLQSEEQFYGLKKIGLLKRYGVQLFTPGLFTTFLRKTFLMSLAFSGT